MTPHPPLGTGALAVTAAGMRVAAYTYGSGDAGAPPVLLIHGLAHWTEAAWGRLIPHLDPQRRYVGFDLPGFGESDKPDVRYDGALFRRAAEDVADAFGLARFALVGHSLGGFIAADLAGARPDGVTRLALISPAGFARVPHHLALGLAAAFGRRVFERAPSRRLVAWILTRGVADRASLDIADIERAYVLAQDLGLRRAFAGVYRSALEAYARRSEHFARFARFGRPVLCAWGTRDRYIPVRGVRDVRAVYPQAEIALLDRSGHMPSIEEPARLGALLRTFLARDDAGARDASG